MWRDARLLAGLGVLFIVATTLDSYSPEHPFSGENPLSIERDHMSLAQRLGYAVMLKSRYAELASAEYGDDVKAPDWIARHPPSLELNQSHPDFACVLYHEELRGIDVQNLTRAIIATEMYNRPRFRRRIEELLAAAWLRVTGRLPSLSLGVGQIRPATARPIVKAELRGINPSNRELLGRLIDRCQNVRIAAEIVNTLLMSAPNNDLDTIIDHVARQYSGSTTVAGRHYWYTQAVLGAYLLITPNRFGK
jgi:hypothetical protein